ncbi:glycosyl transferase [Fibrobacteria bacterium R8-3-H12]
MVKVSVIIPVYNEIRFIQKTLESVVSDADEIILSDNASTDGSSDICQSFANKYPEIKYTRHKENTGMIKNFNFCVNQFSGKYVRNIGAHDMISIGSNQSMARLLDKYADAVMVYPKYVIGLNQDYSFRDFHVYEEFGNDLQSDSAMTRTKSMILNLREFSLFFGMWRAEIFKNAVSHRIYTQTFTDYVALSATVAKGKMFPDDRSVFFRITPRYNRDEDYRKRYINMMSLPLDTNLSFWHFAAIAEQYDLVLEMFNENPEFCEEILNILLAQYSYLFSNSELTLENMPTIIPKKQEFCQYVMNRIKEYIETKKKKKEKMQKIMLETDKKIYLFGAGKASRDIINALPKVCWSAFIENNTSKVGTHDVLPIISFNEFIKQSDNAIICIASPLYGDEMKRQLIDSGFQEDFIIDYYKL